MKKISFFCGLLVVAGLLTACQTTNKSFMNVQITDVDSTKPVEVSGILKKPKGKGPFPAVVLLHTCGGLQPHVTHDWPEFLNGLGYVTLTVDSFGPRGLGSCPNRLQKNRRQVMKDAYGALNHLAAQRYVKANKVAVMGFSWGAVGINDFVKASMKSRSKPEFAAGISFYGYCTLLRSAKKYLYPLMQIIGEKDIRFVDACRSLDNVLATVHILPGAYHAFDASPHKGLRKDSVGNPMLYSAEATAKSKELVKAYLAKHLRE